MNSAIRQVLLRQLEDTRREIKRFEEQIEASSRLTGGQISDKTRIDLPHVKHIKDYLIHLRDREIQLMARIWPPQRAYVPVGMRK